MSFFGEAILRSVRLVALFRHRTGPGVVSHFIAGSKCPKLSCRWHSSSRGRGKTPKSKNRRRQPHWTRQAEKSEKDQHVTGRGTSQRANKSATTQTASKTSFNSKESGASRFFKTPMTMLPSLQLRYRKSGAKYTSEHGAILAQRLPLAFVLVGLFLWDQTSPFSWIILKGPSMLPTMAADGSEVWITYSPWFIQLRRLGGYFHESKSIYRKGDIVGFSPPESKIPSVSCKRVIGVAGDEVTSNGEYVGLFVQQDPVNLGKSPLNPSHDLYQRFENRRQLGLSSSHTEVVPEKHVWVEADNPGMGIDSRQFGPIPEDWIKGVVVGRAWPIWSFKWPLRVRPHPIPLDGETLAKHNVHPVIMSAPQVEPKESDATDQINR